MMKNLKFIIYPPLCVCCNKVLKIDIDFDDIYICEECLILLRGFIELDNICEKCSISLILDNELEQKLKKCTNCIEEEKEFYFDKNISFLQYNEYFSKMLRKFKFGQNKQVGKVFVKIIEEELYRNKSFFESFDYITYIPLHKDRLKSRGFNQSEVLTSQICKILNIDYREDILIKTINTTPQSIVDKNNKKDNVKNAFGVNGKIILKNKRILIIDDVFTSGSTINECANLLKSRGSLEVFSFTILKAGKKL